MNQEEQLIKLLINNSQPTWEIEAVHQRCCIYFGVERAFRECQEIIDFANVASIGLLESFRLHIEVLEFSAKSAE
ncbi:hypothetical protein [Nafulsella turpanensis]|uniref:hypothetical protein n=1 Tax=Nafulsella turpanensis TaxID=1265690 RepID=UPI000477188F|nr:hypothetical protein [Nafulsella turpanensis]